MVLQKNVIILMFLPYDPINVLMYFKGINFIERVTSFEVLFFI